METRTRPSRRSARRVSGATRPRRRQSPPRLPSTAAAAAKSALPANPTRKSGSLLSLPLPLFPLSLPFVGAQVFGQIWGGSPLNLWSSTMDLVVPRGGPLIAVLSGSRRGGPPWCAAGSGLLRGHVAGVAEPSLLRVGPALASASCAVVPLHGLAVATAAPLWGFLHRDRATDTVGLSLSHTRVPATRRVVSSSSLFLGSCRQP